MKINGYLLFLHPDKQDTYRTVNNFYDYIQQMRVKTPAQLQAEGINLEDKMMDIVEENILLREIAPAVARINVINYQNKAEIEASLIIVAIVRYKQERGDYPKNLEDLFAEGFIKELPIDPFSDKPFVYKNTGDDFILYSVGEDFIDNDGEIYRDDRGRVRMWPNTGDVVFWPVQ